MKGRIVFNVLVVSAFALTAFILLQFSTRNGPNRFGRVRIEMAQLAAAIAQYRAEFGDSLPEKNSDLMNILSGENQKKLQFFSVQAERIDSQGNFVDPWKTPYEIKIFHQTYFAIRSAGPNRTSATKTTSSSTVSRTIF